MADGSTSAPKARPAKVALKTRLVVLALAILSASFVMVLLGSLYKKPPTSYSILMAGLAIDRVKVDFLGLARGGIESNRAGH